jgi:Gas vesicle synthesis protein GvpL/GvpF
MPQPREQAHGAQPSGSAAGPLSIYLFCLARHVVAESLEGAGIDEHFPLEVRKFGGNLAAVFAWVKIEDFCGQEAEARMQNLEWLGPRACRHEAVIERMMRLSPVLPAHFGTLFSSPERLAEFVFRHRSGITSFLNSVTGMEEWAVKATLDRARARDRILSEILPPEEGVRASSPGVRHFQEQRARARAEKEVNRWLKTVCGRVVEGLNRAASRSRRRKVLPWGSEGRGGGVVLNWAFLVAEGRLAAFQAEVNQANAEYAPYGLVLEASGPWPPYSFCPSFEENS